ncbi:MAG TPA: hypothetical protein VK558_19105 [Patescibacteria group bacterium]|nr:hypothetical protein [Patescibacteria group bacterium]
MRTRLITAVALAALSAAMPAFAAPSLDLNDFLPPTQGGSTSPSAAAEKRGDVVAAPNMQAAMASAFKQLTDDGGSGVQEVATPSGIGILSAATANYKTYDNQNATILSKRGAYFRAFTEARKELVAHMGGLQNSCANEVKNSRVTLDTGKESAANISSNSGDKCGETVQGMLAAYIVYNVNDNVNDHSVTMVIASSTKTRGAVDHIGGAVIVSDDPRAVWKDIVTEVTSFATPPMGAKLITNPRTGENIIIGFGSAVIRQNSNPAIGRELKKTAADQANMRARSALVSFLGGDKVYWSGGFDEKQVEATEQLAVPTDENGKPGDVQVLDKTRDTFLNGMTHSDDYATVTKGTIPPGVQVKNFASDDGNWEFSIAVYMPSVTAMATQAGAENRAATAALDRANRPGGTANGTTAPAPVPSGHSLQLNGGVNENAPNPRGPSGQVAPKNDF